MSPLGLPKIFLATPGAWHLRQTAKAMEQRGALAGLWTTDKNTTGISAEKYRRCWPFHVAMKPFYHCAPQIWTEKAFYALSPIWQLWFRSQTLPPCHVVQAIMGFASEPFDVADKTGALKVVDCANTHPTSYFGFWQRECDLWCPGERVPIPRWMFARMNRELERADLIVVQSKFAKESMVQNGLPEEKVLINPMGVDTSIFRERQRVPEKPRFVTVGTICLRKGHQYLFRAFAVVKKELPQAELICIGDYKTDFRRERPQWEGTFTHIPHLPHAELADLLQTCTAFVFPSQEEGIARAQIEALASGLPLIGTHEGGATTVIKDGTEGFIVRGRDPRHLAKAMIEVASDRDLNARMGKAAHQAGAAQNTWQDYGDRLLSGIELKLAARDGI
ncbi:MAG: glycosyltransferase family 4 protein [Chthoniobacter sp.]